SIFSHLLLDRTCRGATGERNHLQPPGAAMIIVPPIEPKADWTHDSWSVMSFSTGLVVQRGDKRTNPTVGVSDGFVIVSVFRLWGTLALFWDKEPRAPSREPTNSPKVANPGDRRSEAAVYLSEMTAARPLPRWPIRVV